MIELFVSDNDATNGTIAVTWCVSHETLDLLAKEKVVDPQIIIVVSPDGDNYERRREYRKVVPLKDLMTYIEFRVPGKNNIRAVVSYKTKKEAKNKYLSRDEGKFTSDVLEYDGSDYASWLKGDDQVHMLSPVIAVNVPQDCFAPEPAAWEKAWVNHFFRNKPIDQCNFRRRRMFAYTIQPLIFLALALVKVFFLLVATLIGARNWSLKYLLHPLTYDIESSTAVMKGGSIFIRRLPEDDEHGDPANIPWYVLRKLCLLPLMPLILIPLVLLCLFAKPAVYTGILMGIGFCVVILFVVLLCVQHVAIFATIVNWIAGVIDKFADHDLWYMRQEEMDIIVCDGRAKSVSVSALPAKKRTFALRFSQLKSKVCRPFSA